MVEAEKISKVDGRLAIAFTGVLTGAVAVVVTTTSVVTSNSVALIADMIGTFFEFLAVLFSFLTLRKMSRKEGHAFDYGFGKLENLVSTAIGVFIFISLSVVVFNAVGRFANPEPITGFGVWLMIGAHSVYMVINGTLCWRSKCAMREHASVLMESQFRLYAVKTFSNICLFIALTLSLALHKLTAAMYIDPVMSIVISANMFLGAYKIITTNLGALLDKTLEEEAQLRIMKVLSESFDEYVQFHGVRSRRSGNKVFIELFLEFEGDRKMSDVQSVIEGITVKIEGAIPHSEVSIVPSTKGRSL